MKGEWKYELEAAARGTAGTVEAQRGFTRQIRRSRRNLWIDWCQIWRKRLWFEKLPVDTEGTRGRRADCDCRSWITSESFSHTNSITFSVFIGAFSSEAFKSWVEIQEIWNMWGKNRRIVFILGWDATVCAPIVDMKWRETDWNTLSDPVKTVCMSCCVDFFGITRNHNVREASDTRNLKNQKTSDLWRALKTFPSHFQHVVFSWIHLVLTSWLLNWTTGWRNRTTSCLFQCARVQESLFSFSDSRPVSPMCWSAV